MKHLNLVSWSIVLGMLVMPLQLFADDQSEDEAAIRRAVASYIEAFNRGVAFAVAEVWSPAGEL